MVRSPLPNGGFPLPTRRRPTLEKSLFALERAFAEIAATLEKPSTRIRRMESGAAKKSPATKAASPQNLRITPKRRAQLKLQGRYIGHLRYLKPRQKARVKAVKERSGFEAAIKMARKLAGN